MDEIASTLLELEVEFDDVPEQVGNGKKKYPLGRYLRRRLRARVGRDEKTPEKVQEEIQEKLRPLREIAEVNAPRGFKNFYLQTLITEAYRGKRERLEGRYNRGRKKGNL